MHRTQSAQIASALVAMSAVYEHETSGGNKRQKLVTFTGNMHPAELERVAAQRRRARQTHPGKRWR